MKFGNLIEICIWVSLALCIISERSLITISKTTTLTSCREKKSNIRGMRSKIGQQGSTQSQITSEYTLETGWSEIDNNT